MEQAILLRESLKVAVKELGRSKHHPHDDFDETIKLGGRLRKIAARIADADRFTDPSLLHAVGITLSDLSYRNANTEYGIGSSLRQIAICLEEMSVDTEFITRINMFKFCIKLCALLIIVDNQLDIKIA